MVEAVDIKKFVNDILAKKGIPPVKNFAKEFADGSKTSFNLSLYFYLSPIPNIV